MADSDELRNREQQAGNQADNLNPGQKDSDETFRRKGTSDGGGAEDEYDEAEFGKRKPSGYTDSHGDAIKSNYNADDPDDSSGNVKDKEEAGGDPSLYTPSKERTIVAGPWDRFKANVKLFAPSAGIIGFIIGGFGTMSVFMLPAALLMALEKAVTNDGSDSARTNIVMRRAYMGGIIGKGDCSTPAKCKATMISDKQKEKWEKLGFKVETTPETRDGRTVHSVKSITFPDGRTKATNGGEFNRAADSSLQNRRLTNRVLNIRAAFFQNAKFQNVLDKFKIKKTETLKSSRDRDKETRTRAINTSFNENTDVGNDGKGGIARMRATLDELKRNAGRFRIMKGAGAASTAISMACTTYNTIRVTIALIKAEWIYQLVRFSYPFVQAASQLYDQGNIEPEVVENLADRLTWYQKPETADTPEEKEKVNLTAMDSQGLQMALYGDETALKEFTENYTTAKMAYAIIGSSLVREVQENLGKDNIRLVCQANSIASTASSAQCLAGPAAASLCVALVGGALLFSDDVARLAIDYVAGPAMELIEKANLNSDLKGVDAGNALAAGIGLLLSSSTLGAGLRPSTGGAFKNFITATDDLNYKYGEELARYEAKETPFDMTNQYSFAGQIVSSFYTYRSNDNALYGPLVNMFSVVGSSFARLSPSAQALHSQPSNMTLSPEIADNRTGKCKDTDMHEIGADCDWSGRLIGNSSPEFLKKAERQASGQENEIIKTIDYMTANEFIDEKGAVKGNSDKNKYKKYKDFCTEDRVDPLGTSSRSADEGSAEDQEWFIGEKCLVKNKADEEMFDHFAFYFNYCETQIPTAEEIDGDCSQDTPAPAAVNTGDWIIPVDVACQDGFGARGGAHMGVDMAAPSGTPIRAPTSLKITFVGNSNDGSTGNQVTATATDGTEYSFRFMHMLSQSVTNGQEVAKGDEIGLVGSTGDSTGPHLHMDVFPPGNNGMSYSGQVDPVTVFADHGVTITCQS